MSSRGLSGSFAAEGDQEEPANEPTKRNTGDTDRTTQRKSHGNATGLPDTPEQPSRRIEPFPGVVVLPDVPAVELRGWVCLEEGWLEQIACGPGTREHESLVVPEATPSQIHAALLLAGFEPGHPGEWSLTPDGEFVFTPPRGSPLDVFVRHGQPRLATFPVVVWRGLIHVVTLPGEETEEPISAWIRDHHGINDFPDAPWVFGGSRLEPIPEGFGEGEYYVADQSGSIIGLVTFGDEVVGFSRVFADAASVQAPEWEVNRDRVPPVGTEVVLILRGRGENPGGITGTGE